MVWYLKSAFDAYDKVQDAMQTRFSEMQAAVTSPLQTVRRILGMEQETGHPAQADELHRLRQRITELEARLAQAERRRAPKARRRRAADTKTPASR
jgi:BMFP domain-containing protein YqiC